MNKLYFGDNLEIMREMSEGSIDLICTDPPFNSGRHYNAFFQESKAQSKAYTDIWQWDDAAKDSRDDIRKLRGKNDTYKALDTCLEGYDCVLQNAVSGNKGSMRAYLAFMAPRLAEMHKLLKDTGSIYLHCDPTASHYLKGIMDAIWDQNNLKNNGYFKNEIVWHYQAGTGPKTAFKRKHDIILFYTKSSNSCFNRQSKPVVNPARYNRTDEDGRAYDVNGQGNRYYLDEGQTCDDVWTYIQEKEFQQLNSQANERLGYPTQKPRVLYERMVKASSNPGDLVLDPFCGCGTTIDASHSLDPKRFWMGIDLTIIALDPIQDRMQDRHGLSPHSDYEIIGYPTNMQEVNKLVRDQKRYHDFSNWAVTRLGFKPTRDVGDGGKDGVGHVALWNPDTEEETPRRILAEVKAGNPTIQQVKAFCHTIKEQEAVAGIFITLGKVTSGMRQIAEGMKYFELEDPFEVGNTKRYPRLQFWQIDDTYFDNPNILNNIIRLPRNWIQPRKKSERHIVDRQMELLETDGSE